MYGSEVAIHPSLHEAIRLEAFLLIPSSREQFHAPSFASISLACRPFCKLVTAPLKIFAVPLSVGGKVGTPALRRIFVDEKSEYMRSRLEADF